MVAAMPLALLPAAATNVTPAAVAAQIALCSASLLAAPQLPSLAPAPATLMFATRMFSAAAFAATQLMPHSSCDSVPDADLLSTLTAYSRVPGATPTTPLPSSRAPTMPATLVPWPLSSLGTAPAVTQL